MFQIIEVISTWGIGFALPVIATGLLMVNLEVKKAAEKNL